MKRMTAWLLAVLLLLPLAACADRGKAVEPTVEPVETALPISSRGRPEPSAPEAEAAPASAAPVPVRITGTTAELEDTELVCVSDCLPEVFIELRYSTSDNFTGQAIYPFSDAWLRYGTVRKLAEAQKLLGEYGYALKLWDAYRPLEMQFSLWAAWPDSTYVADPHRGRSTHANGGTVDVTLVARDGTEIAMPTDFDAFSPLADRDYSDVSDEARANAELLETAMTAAGFIPYAGEWWHFADCESYPFEDLESLRFPLDRQTAFEPVCEEYISLRARPEYGSEVLARIPRGAVFGVMGWAGDFARVKYDRQQGYVSCAYIRPAEP